MKANTLNSSIKISARYGGGEPVQSVIRQPINFELKLFGQRVCLQLDVPDVAFSLSDIVPMASAISDRITQAVIDKFQSDGTQISCEKGCSACCSYLVPLSIPEVFWLEEIILAKGKSKSRQLMRSCLLAARSILKQKPPEIFSSEAVNRPEQRTVDISAVANWYSNLKVNCPFLLNGTCMIYEQRPLVCREHLVTVLPRLCKEKNGLARALDMPVRVSTALSRLTGELEGKDTEAVLLPLIPVWCGENHHRNDRKWSAVDMVNRFMQILKEMSSENISLPVGASV